MAKHFPLVGISIAFFSSKVDMQFSFHVDDKLKVAKVEETFHDILNKICDEIKAHFAYDQNGNVLYNVFFFF